VQLLGREVEMAPRLVRHPVDEEDSYFISMTDLMVGLLFIFIIMLMVFALQYREAERKNREAEQVIKKTTERLVDADRVRDEILEHLQKYLSEHGLKAEIVKNQGVLRLGERILFDSGSPDTTNDKAVDILAQALATVLPCYTAISSSPPPADCPPKRAVIDSIFIEGHTDIDVLTPRPGMRDNLDLSAIRAANTFRRLVTKRPDLLDFKNTREFAILSVSGYGEYRPAAPGEPTQENKAKNRRIDLRILMTTPRAEDAARFEREINEELRNK
jgi:flagellar motor protein MotB